MSSLSDSLRPATHRVARRPCAALVAAFGLAVLVAPAAMAQPPMQVARMAGGAACVALTFDDGPDVKLTPLVLATLEEKRVPATFFVLGYRAAAWPDLIAREYG